MRQRLGVGGQGVMGEKSESPVQVVGGSKKPEVEPWNATGAWGSGGSRETPGGPSACLWGLHLRET